MFWNTSPMKEGEVLWFDNLTQKLAECKRRLENLPCCILLRQEWIKYLFLLFFSWLCPSHFPFRTSWKCSAILSSFSLYHLVTKKDGHWKLMVKIVLIWFVTWHFLFVIVWMVKEIDTAYRCLNGTDWLIDVCNHSCFCTSALPDKGLNRTLQFHRRLQHYMISILWDVFVWL